MRNHRVMKTSFEVESEARGHEAIRAELKWLRDLEVAPDERVAHTMRCYCLRTALASINHSTQPR